MNKYIVLLLATFTLANCTSSSDLPSQGDRLPTASDLPNPQLATWYTNTYLKEIDELESMSPLKVRFKKILNQKFHGVLVDYTKAGGIEDSNTTDTGDSFLEKAIYNYKFIHTASENSYRKYIREIGGKTELFKPNLTKLITENTVNINYPKCTYESLILGKNRTDKVDSAFIDVTCYEKDLFTAAISIPKANVHEKATYAFDIKGFIGVIPSNQINHILNQVSNVVIENNRITLR